MSNYYKVYLYLPAYDERPTEGSAISARNGQFFATPVWNQLPEDISEDQDKSEAWYEDLFADQVEAVYEDDLPSALRQVRESLPEGVEFGAFYIESVPAP